MKKGETSPIFAGSILHYKSFAIDEGGALEINDGRQKITYIKSDGDCNINGKISSKRFRSGASTFKETSPDGEILTVILDETNKGGAGGRGGYGAYGSCINRGPVPGGQGDFGTADYGGGGGGGSRMYYMPGKCTPMQGGDASGQRGGKSSAAQSNGGDGAGRTPKRNGGYLFLKCLGKISLKGSNVDFKGEDGVKGGNGEPEGGGGGGGGPGGQGGVLFINKAPIDYNPKNTDFSGGAKGSGGSGGAVITTGSRGENGKDGESGFSGDMELVDQP